MNVAELLVDGFGRIREVVHDAVGGLSADLLVARPGPKANSISWLVWHLTRVQDDHVAGVAGLEQVWTGQDWHGRFGLPFPAGDIGYGHRSEDVAAVRITDPDLLIGYHDAVHEQTVDWVSGLSGSDLGRVIDENWDPPVTLGVRLVSVLSDDLQHAGQAAYLRGLLGG
ncbi:mycothiol transferase [Amycolatopsis jiangsuensis]|uniref:Damage-inducible protein DinB n=1 Tax=Amycolatopsis jiangsuensis TaxID=1181879 RepID=A0A840ILN0_9PSEU|nr:DUF664 domain-containing protein [Amycolatopsis jiangsuensis]MBB4682843.1 hypothetical protein [Amycolatopsis jiangsuensis]